MMELNQGTCGLFAMDVTAVIDAASNGSLYNELDRFENIVVNESNGNLTNNAQQIQSKCAMILLKTARNVSLDSLFEGFNAYLDLIASPVASPLGCCTMGIKKLMTAGLLKGIARVLKPTDHEVSVTESVPVPSTAMDDDELDEVQIQVVDASQDAEVRRSSRRTVTTSRATRPLDRQQSTTDNRVKKRLENVVLQLSGKLSWLSESADEELAMNISDLIVALTFFAESTSAKKECLEGLSACLRFAMQSSRLTKFVHQSLLPVLTFSFGRCLYVPESWKTRSAFHSYLIEVYAAAVPRFLVQHEQPYQYFDDLNSSSLPDDSLLDASFDSESLVSGSAKKKSRSERSIPAKDNASPAVSTTALQPHNATSWATGCVLGTVHRIALSNPDRANVRQVLSKSLLVIMNELASHKNLPQVANVLSVAMTFLAKMAKSSKVAYRSFAMEISCALVNNPNFSGDVVIGTLLLSSLLGRCEDASPAVRLKAVGALSDFTERCAGMQRCVTTDRLWELVNGDLSADKKSLLDVACTLIAESKPLLRVKALQLYTAVLTTKWSEWVSTATAAQSLQNGYLVPTLADVSNVCECFADESIAVKKQAMQSLTDLLRVHLQSDLLLTNWIQAVVPLCLDSEGSVVAKVCNIFADLVIAKVATDQTMNSLEGQLAWTILFKIGELGMNPLLKTMTAMMMKQGNITFEGGKSSCSFYTIMRMCENICGRQSGDIADQSEAVRCCFECCWLLMEAIAGNAALRLCDAKGVNFTLDDHLRKSKSTLFVLQTFKAYFSGNEIVTEDKALRVLKVLDKVIPTLLAEDATIVANEVEKHLHMFAVSTPCIALFLSIRFQISKLIAERASGANNSYQAMRKETTAWILPLMESAARVLQQLAFDRDKVNEQTESRRLHEVQLALFMIGEMSMFGFKLDEVSPKMLAATSNNCGDDQALMSVMTNDTGYFRVVLSDRLIDLIKLMMGTTLPGVGEKRCPTSIRAVAFVTMGKLCMRDHHLARDTLNIFLRELSVDEEEKQNTTNDLSDLSFSFTGAPSVVKNSVRNNSFLVLVDLCMRHTHLVDRHIDTLACCMQDRDPMIRKNALILISQLLMQDYVKMKGLLLYRFLMMTVDDDYETTMFAREVIERSLCLKHPGLLVNHFSETFIVLNKCLEHPIYSAVAFRVGHDMSDEILFTQSFDLDSSVDMLDSTTKAFHSSHDLTRQQRFMIYNFMANNITDEMKIQITAKLVNDILSSAVDHANRLLPDRNHLQLASSKKYQAGNPAEITRFETAVEDVFIFLRSPALKVGSKKRGSPDSADDDAMEEGGNDFSQPSGTAASLAQAKTKVLKALSSQHMISHVLPVVMSLKHCLERVKSPLQGALMEYLLTLVKQYRSEVEQALQFDPTLKAEIEFDLRHYERVRKENAAVSKKNALTTAVTAADPALSTVKKPVLKSARKSAQQGTKNKGTTVRFSDANTAPVAGNAVDEEEDPMLRLTQPVPDETAITNENMPSGLTNILDAASSSLLGSASKHSAQKRRSWGVVVSALQPEEHVVENTSNGKKTLNDVHMEGSRSSPAKKRSRRSKSRSPPAFLALQQQLQQVQLQLPQPLGLEYFEEDALKVKKLDTLFEAAAAVPVVAATAGGKRSSKVQSVSLLAMK